MFKRLTLFIVLLATFGSAAAFDFSAYPLRDVDALIQYERRGGVENAQGVKIIRPSPKFSFEAKLESMPVQCNTSYLLQVMAMQGYRMEQLPPIHTCLKVRTAKGEVINLYIQDAVAEFIGKELKQGETFHLYVMYLFFNTYSKTPGLLVNEFQKYE